jgi:hypothetical protein
MGLLQWKDAIKDLRKAGTLCPVGDTAQKELIDAKLAIARAHQRCGESTDLSDIDSPTVAGTAGGTGGAASFNDGSISFENVTNDPPTSTQRAAAAPAPAAGVPWAGGMGGASSAQAQEAMRMLAENPEQAKQMAAAMESMSDEEYQRMAQMSGMPNIDRGMVTQACRYVAFQSV